MLPAVQLMDNQLPLWILTSRTVVTLAAALFLADAKRLPTSLASSASVNLMIMPFFSKKTFNITKIAEMRALVTFARFS